MDRAHTNREKLIALLDSRTQRQTRWTLEELAQALCVEPRTVQRYLRWLRVHGYLDLRA